MSTCKAPEDELEQLPEPGDHLDVLGADAAKHRRAELLVATSEDRALAADDPHDHRRRLVPEHLEQLALAEVGAEQPSRAHRVDAEQRLRETEMLHHAPDGGARTENIDPPRVERIRDRRARGIEGDLVRRQRADLRTGHPLRIVRHLRRAVKPRRDAAFAECVLVDIEDVGRAHARSGAAGQERCSDLPRTLRRAREHARMHLHAGWNPEDRDALADRVVDVPRRAVAAGEEDQVDAATPELGGSGARVGSTRRAARAGARWKLLGRERSLVQEVGAHHRRGRNDLDVDAGGLEPVERSAGPLCRERHRAEEARALENLDSITPLEADPAAETGDRIDDQAQARHAVSPRSGSPRQPRRPPSS